MVKQRYIFFDRDGTLNREVEYLSDPEQVELYPEVVPALQRLTAVGYGIIVVTNQSGIGRGFFTVEAMQRVNARVEEILAEYGVQIARFYYCPHLASDGCNCRKPRSGMLEAAAQDFGIDLADGVITVGDKLMDVELGQRVGGKGILLRTGHGMEFELEQEATVPDFVAPTMSEAVDWILSR